MNQLKGLKIKSLIFGLIISFAFSVLGQEKSKYSFALDQIIPINPNVTTGELENGMKYFIRENKKPEKRAELRLVINAGAILEDDDQQGLAHVVEHMAFNGTKNFAKQELVDYIESIGMKFGADVNAGTGIDETVYMLQVPTDSIEIMEKAFQILEDWAHNVSFEDEEIDKERGIVIEEWRLGRGAGARMRDEQIPILFKGSRYAERNVIGDEEILKSFTYDALKRFYKEWYRPDLMAFIGVGDFDKEWIENLVVKYFNRIPKKDNKKERKYFPVPDHAETLFAIATDKEATGNSVAVYFKKNLKEQKTVANYREDLLEGIYSLMLNQRLSELLQNAEPPFLYAGAGGSNLTRTKDVYYILAAVKENGIENGLKSVLVEAARAKNFGFTKSELERAKTMYLRSFERAYKERDKTKSISYASEYIRHFLTGEPIPGIEYEYELVKKYVPEFSLEEVNNLSDNISEKNRVIMVNAPEKEGVEVPSEDELLAVFDEVKKMNITAYEDEVSDSPLIANLSDPGRVLSEKRIEDLDVTEWKLSNGITVVLKPTDFKNDEIRFSAFSPGGHSLSSDKDYFPATSSSIVVSEGGLGEFDKIQLGKLLTGKIASASPYIASLSEGLSGMASPKDIETMFQLIHLTFTQPRKDSTAFLSYQTRMKGIFENQQASPSSAYSDTIRVTMAQYHHRVKSLSMELLDDLDLEKSFEFYKDRFADASDFTFVFVGNFEPNKLKSLVNKYLANLPNLNRKETWKDVGIRPPKGVINKTVKKGIEQKSTVNIIFTGPHDYGRLNNYCLGSSIAAFQIKLREVVREELGGTYSIRISASRSKYPKESYRISINFGCSPDRVEELTQTVFKQIDSLKTVGLSEDYVKKVKENQLRSYETNLKENSFWLNNLAVAYEYGRDPKNILTYEKDLVEKFNQEVIRNVAKKYFNMKNYAKFVLLPEKEK